MVFSSCFFTAILTFLFFFHPAQSFPESPTPTPPAPTPAPTQGPTRSGREPPDGEFIPDKACRCALLLDCTPRDNCHCKIDTSSPSQCTCQDVDNPFGGWKCGSNWKNCCEGHLPTRRDRQLKLQESPSLEVDMTDPDHYDLYQSYLDTCGDVEYTTYLYVTSHVYAVATPSRDDGVAGDIKCPFLVTHAHFESTTDQKTVATKKLLFWGDAQEGETKFAHGKWHDNGKLVGQFKLTELARAYEAVDPTSGGAFDIWTNNCGNYIVQLATELEIKIDSHVTGYVTRRLVEQSSSQMMEMLKRPFTGESNSTDSVLSSFKAWIVSCWNWLWGVDLEIQDEGSVSVMAGLPSSSDNTDEAVEKLVKRYAVDLL